MKILKKFLICFSILIFFIFMLLIILVVFGNKNDHYFDTTKTSLSELEFIKSTYTNYKIITGTQGIVNQIVDDKNKIYLSSRYMDEFDLLGYEHQILYVTDNCQVFDFLTLEKKSIEDIQKDDMLIIDGKLYDIGTYKYIDATKGSIKILTSTDYYKLELDYFLGKKKIENAEILINMDDKIVIRVYQKIDNINIPLILTAKLPKDYSYNNEITNSKIIDITFENELDSQCLEKTSGIIKDITYEK